MKKYNYPDKKGNFGQFGGRYVPEPLIARLEELNEAYSQASKDKIFLSQLQSLYKNYVGRPSRLYFAQRLSDYCQGAQIYLKREDLNHTGAHKINNTVGQALLAKRMGKKKLIAETGAGQHGLATATVAALHDMECDIYMGQRDVENQAVNVDKMRLLGANIISVHQGRATLKEAVDAALTAYVEQPESYYMLGSVVGPHPYPLMVRDFQKIIGQEVRSQILQLTDKLPDYLVACIGGGSNAMGLFYEFLNETQVQLVGVEPAGKGSSLGQHGMALGKGSLGQIHGFKCLLLQNDDGEVSESYSAASGLDYPGVGPEPSLLKQQGRLKVVGVSDETAVKAFVKLSKLEGIIPALESAHAVAQAMTMAKKLSCEQTIVVNLSGRGDKDVRNINKNLLKKYGIEL